MIQGGGYTTSFVEKPTLAPIPLESKNGLKNTTGTLAMFSLINLALLRIKMRDDPNPLGQFRCPRWVPLAGFLGCSRCCGRETGRGVPGGDLVSSGGRVAVCAGGPWGRARRTASASTFRIASSSASRSRVISASGRGGLRLPSCLSSAALAHKSPDGVRK